MNAGEFVNNWLCKLVCGCRWSPNHDKRTALVVCAGSSYSSGCAAEPDRTNFNYLEEQNEKLVNQFNCIE